MALSKDKFDILLNFSTLVDDAKLKSELNKLEKAINSEQDKLKIDINDEQAIKSLQNLESQLSRMFSIYGKQATEVDKLASSFSKLGSTLPTIGKNIDVSKYISKNQAELQKLESSLTKYKSTFSSLGVEMPAFDNTKTLSEQTKSWDRLIDRVRVFQNTYSNFQNALGNKGTLSNSTFDSGTNISQQVAKWKSELANFGISVDSSKKDIDSYSVSVSEAFGGIGRKITTFTQDGTEDVYKLSQAGKDLIQTLSGMDSLKLNFVDNDDLKNLETLSKYFRSGALTSLYTNEGNATQREAFKFSISEGVVSETTKTKQAFDKLIGEFAKAETLTLQKAKEIAKGVGANLNIGNIVMDSAGDWATNVTIAFDDILQKVNTQMKLINNGTGSSSLAVPVLSGSSTITDTSASVLKDYEQSLSKLLTLQGQLSREEQSGNANSANVIREKINIQQEYINKLKNTLSANKDNTTVLQELNNIQNRFNETVKTNQATEQDKLVNQALKDYRTELTTLMSLRQQLTKAEQSGSYNTSEYIKKQISEQNRLVTSIKNTITSNRSNTTALKELDAIQKSVNQNSDKNKAVQQDALVTQDLKAYEKTLNSIYTLNNQLTKAQEAGNQNTVADIQRKIQAEEEYKRLLLDILNVDKNNVKIQSELERINKDQQSRKATDLAVQQDTATTKALKDYENSLNRIISLEQKLDQAQRAGNTHTANDIQQTLNAERQQLSNITALISGNQQLVTIQQRVQQTRNSNNAVVQDQTEAQQIQKLIALYNEYTKAQLKAQQVANSPNSSNQQRQQAIMASQSALNSFNSELARVNPELRNNTTLVNGMNTANRNLSQGLRDAEKSQKSLLSGLKNIGKQIVEVTKNVFEYQLAWNLISYVSRGIRESIALVKELDTAMINLRMVTGQTAEEAKETINTYAELGKTLGATASQVADGSIEWLRQGFTVSETTQLLEASTKLSKLGMIESADATTLMTATLNGFKMEASDAISIVDKLVEADIRYATSAQEIATALQYTSASAQMANVSLDEMVGMITVVSETTRRSAETIGQSFKTIFSRLQNVSSGKDIDDEGEAINDVERALNSMGISLRNSAHEWRDMSEVLSEVGTRWQEFSDVEKAQITTALAG